MFQSEGQGHWNSMELAENYNYVMHLVYRHATA